MLQKEHSSYQKYCLAKMAPNINGISQKWHFTTTLLDFWSTINTLLTETTFTIRHRRVIGISLWKGKNSTLKSHDHESEPYNKFKNFLLKITQLSPWQIISRHFFTSCVIFVRHQFLWVSYLFLSGGLFFMCHFCKVALFSNGIKGCPFAGCIWWLSNCNCLLFYQ